MKDWTILVRDDGSTDQSQQIMSVRASQDSRIHLLPSSGHAGVLKGFDILLKAALQRGAQSIYFCDHDDVWHPDKIRDVNARMQRLSREDRPILVHTDLRVVNGQGQVMADSLLEYAGWCKPDQSEAARVLMSGNFVTGCALALNRSAAELVSPIPEEAGMHDGWAALLVAWMDGLHFVARPMVDYRLHGGNLVGVGSRQQKVSKFLRGLPSSFWERVEMTQYRLKRARAARDRLLERGVPAEEIRVLNRFIRLSELHPICRIPDFLSQHLPWHNWLGWLSFMATLPWVSREET